MSQMLQSCVNLITSWFNINKVTVNTDKTYTILISSQSHKDKDAPLSINSNGIPLVQRNEVIYLEVVIYLGVTIDSHLTWIPHIYKQYMQESSTENWCTFQTTIHFTR